MAPLSALIAMLYFHGADATTAVADALLLVAGGLMMQRVSALLAQAALAIQGDAPAASRGRGKQIDRYTIENMIRSLELGLFCAHDGVLLVVGTCSASV